MPETRATENAPFYVLAKTPDGVTPPILSLEWRVWAQGTSFYLTTRSTLKEFKISLHGPQRPGYDNYWKAGYDAGYVKEHGKEGILRYASVTMQDDSRALAFTGKSIGTAVRHAVRMRWVGDLFQPGAPTGTPPKRVKEYSQALVIPAPPVLQVAHLDFFVSQGQPWWPGGKTGRDRDALMGPLRNAADQYLTAVPYREWVIGPSSEVPDRSDPILLPPKLQDRVRGLSYVRHENGFLEVEERWMPRTSSN